MKLRRIAAAVAALLGLGALMAACASSDCPGGNCFPQNDTTTGGTTGTGGSTGGLCASSKDCNGGKACCAGACVDVQTDSDNCGACNVPCGNPLEGSVACVAGACKLTCAAGHADCDLLIDDGCEVDLTSDAEHCGSCKKACLFANTAAACAAGACTVGTCEQGFADCNKTAADGCEANLGTDPNNCSVCGSPCFPAPNSAPTCAAGQCVLGSCNDGFADCNAKPNDGCEADLHNDATSCGSCGKTCEAPPHAAAACKNAGCAVGACEAGYGDCDLSVWSGCESLLATDAMNCGACGAPCAPVPHGFPSCAAGACLIGGCDAGYADCDGDLVNGCEVNLANDAGNCGACDNLCPTIPNGTPTCAGFQCGIGACGADYADCYGGSANGCETHLPDDVDNCGGCGNACPLVDNGARACLSGACGISSCATNFGDCDMALGDGCEVNLQTDVANCGVCGNVCPTPANGTAGCVAGACTLASCNAGYSNCDGSIGNGCELNTTIDAGNCGGCGITCGAGVCQASQCVCFNTVLLIGDDGPSGAGTKALAAALTAKGSSVTTAPVAWNAYDGTKPALAGFGAVVLLLGTSQNADMPAGGQQAIANFVNAGNGLVMTEWAAYQVASGRLQTLAPFVLLNRTASYPGQVTYTVDPAFASHPLWAGLPATFTFASTSNVGLAKVAAGVTKIASSAQALDAVAIRDVAKGRVVHVSHASDYLTPNGWTNANMTRLMSNAVGWVSRCQ